MKGCKQRGAIKKFRDCAFNRRIFCHAHIENFSPWRRIYIFRWSLGPVYTNPKFQKIRSFSETVLFFYLVNTASCQEMSAYTWKRWSGWKRCSISARPVGGAVTLLQTTEENGEEGIEHAHKAMEDRSRDPTSNLLIAERLLYHLKSLLPQHSNRTS